MRSIKGYLTTCFGCLADQRRRCVLSCLRDRDEKSATFDELVDLVVERGSHSSFSDRETTAIGLYHVHLPKLADCDLVTYEQGGDVIAITDRARESESVLEFGPTEDSSEETTT